MWAWTKITFAWLMLGVSGVTLSQLAIVLTIIFTALQIYKQIREIRRERRLERLEAKLNKPE
jgi:hypothetical protein